MNLKLILSSLLLFSGFYFVQAQGFVQVNGSATDIAIKPYSRTQPSFLPSSASSASTSSKVYIVDVSKNVLSYDEKSKKFIPFGPQKKNITHVDVGPKSKVMMISTSKYLNELWNRRWRKRGEPKKLNGFAVDMASRPWGIVAPNNSLQYSPLNEWKSVTKSTIKGVAKVSPINANLFYFVKTDKSVYKCTKGKLEKMPRKGIDIAVDFKTKEVYLVDESKRVMQWRERPKKWVLLSGTRRDIKNIAVYDGKIWVTSTSNKIYYYDKNKKVVKKPTPAPNKYEGTYRFTLTRILTNAPEQKHIKKGIDIFGSTGIYVVGKKKSGTQEIKPLARKKNQLVNISKKKSAYVKSNGQPRRIKIEGKGGKMLDYVYYGEHKVGQTRDFKISGDTANKDLTFDIQTNWNQKTLTGDLKFGWKRRKIKVDEVTLGQEQFFMLVAGTFPSTRLFIGYKITKN